MTGLRGVAALLVAIYHINPPDRTSASVLARFVGKGYLWVDLFFVLSGFLMALNYSHLFASGWSPRAWVDFLLRRLARVYPLYLAVTAAGIAGAIGHLPAPVAMTDGSGWMAAANLLMIQSWGITGSIDGAAWSLSTEWAAYLLFPALVWLALLGRPVLAWSAGLVVLASMAGTVGLTMHDGAYHSGPLDAYDGTTAEPMLRCLGGFTLGLIACRLARSVRFLAWSAHDATVIAAVTLLTVGLMVGVHDLAIVPLFALVVLGLYGNRGMIGRLFGCWPIHRLGVLSYSVYLLHPYLVAPRAELEQWLDARMPAPWAAAAANLVIYGTLAAAAALACRCIEDPGRRWMQRLGRPVEGGYARSLSAS
jgi:peptidoglycan/LPS O-acetylase OafA/YrhL